MDHILPDEILRQTFEQFLTPFQLKSVRLVCRDWNRLVCDSAKLLDRYRITVPAGGDALGGWQHVTTSRYTTVQVWNLTVGMVPSVPLATTIRILRLVNPWITARQLVGMLGCLPNLVHLGVVAVDNFNYELYETMPAVQLDSLESLNLNLGVKDEFLCIFQGICPRLKGLQVNMVIKKYLEAPYGTKLLEFIRSTRNTLVDVWFNGIEFREESLLRDIAAIEGLKLKDVTLTNSFIRPSDIVHLCQSQTSIETLKLPACNIGSEVSKRFKRSSCWQITHNIFLFQILTLIATHLPNLNELKVQTEIVALQHILSNLPRLQSLMMRYAGQFNEILNLSAWQNPHLLHLNLDGFFLTSTTLLTFFKRSPNIQTLKLYFHSTTCAYDLFVVAGQLKELRRLTVSFTGLAPTPIHFMDISLSPFRKLRQMEIFGELYCDILGELLENCPLLQDLNLTRCLITDDDMLLLVPFMKNLTKLSFGYLQAVGVSSYQLVMQRCRKLETLTIANCPLFGHFVPQQSSVRVNYQPYFHTSY